MILVTGSCGFLGSNLCHRLSEDVQMEVLGVDVLNEQSNRNWIRKLEKVPKRLVFQQIDLTNREALKSLFDNYPIRQIVHLAAETHVDRSITDSRPFWHSNVIGTQCLMSYALNYEVDVVVNQITDEVYGEKPKGEAYEGDQFCPTSPYPCSKVGQYWVGRSFCTTYGLPVISTFPVNCYGPRQYREKIIPKFLNNLLLMDKPVPLMASTHFQRDWLPVDSMCDAFLTLLHKGKIGEDYNIGADNHRTNKQLTYEILELCEKDPEKYIQIVPDRKAHDCRYAVNSDKIKSLGWQISYPFKDYLKYTVDWYKHYYDKTKKKERRCSQ